MYQPVRSPYESSQEDSKLSSTSTLLETFGEWQVRSDVLYLDNGAFGACPKIVSEKQVAIRQTIEENPHDFFERAYVPACVASKEALADFLDVETTNLVILPGATHGLNVVIQSLKFDRDDEILTTNHAYSSVRLALDHVARRDGARVVVVDLPLIMSGPEDALQLILAAVTPRTRFAVIDHVPSRSGLILPAKEIVRELEALGVDTLVDGAHAPGMIPLSLPDINAAYYVANCHKWMCNPRGVGFLHVRQDKIENIKPLVIARSPYVVNRAKFSSLDHCFGWMGTHCPTAMLSLPSSINFLRTVVPGGYHALLQRNHDLAVLARRIVCKALGITVPCPDSMIGAMATIPLPDSPGPEKEGMLPLQQALWNEHRIVIPVYSWPAYPKRVIRLSVQAYNSLDQYLQLADCLRAVLYEERNPVPKNLSHWPIKSSQWSDVRSLCNGSASTDSSSVCDHHADSDPWNKGDISLKTPHQDIENPTPWLLFWLTQSRMRRIILGEFASYPVSLYPTFDDSERRDSAASEFQNPHGNLESSRMVKMLTSSRRRIPKLMAPLISLLLATDDVIEKWHNSMETLRNQAQNLTRTIMADLAAPSTPTKFPLDSKDFVGRVVPYESESHDDNLSLVFWRRALADFTNKAVWSPAHVTSFLQIHSFLKDPIGGLRNNAETQTDLFLSLFDSLKPELGTQSPLLTEMGDVAAQLAVESSFMLQPLVRNTGYVHFSGDQQLVYAYVDIRGLARTEFASPPIVLGMIREVLESSRNEHAIAPVTAARSYPICSSHDARDVIVDGNNRITTIALMMFVALHGVPQVGETEELNEFCRDRGLGPIYFVDLCTVIQMLWESAVDVIEQLKTRSERLALFNGAYQIPVLVTEESSFITELRAGDGKRDVLQPVHQSLFATDDLLVALPAKMQSHGRAKGFKAMPIRRIC